VEIRLEYVDSQVQIAVSDTGKGISADFFAVCFRPLPSKLIQVQRGAYRISGLGLAIARHIGAARLSRSRVRAQGRGGSAVKLPLLEEAGEAGGAGSWGEENPSQEPAPSAPPRLNGLQCVVDDGRRASKFVSTVLEECRQGRRLLAPVNWQRSDT